MKLFDKTVHCTVNLPEETNKIVEMEVQRTGIQKAIFLRCLIMRWADTKGNNPQREEHDPFQVMKNARN